MSFLEGALNLAELGFYVFPLKEGKKTPLHTGWQAEATRDPLLITKMWTDPHIEGIEKSYNIGIFTGKFGDGEALVVIDVDNKGDKNGDEEIIRLELEGRNFPETWGQKTPTGGRHLVYKHSEPIKQGADILGRGLDIRSRGGYIVGAGSSVGGGTYTSSSSGTGVTQAPDWILTYRVDRIERESSPGQERPGVDLIRARTRAGHYLREEAPLAVEGNSGDQTTYIVACRVKDFGVDETTCFELMMEFWNPRCSPPWGGGNLMMKVANAYRYGVVPKGNAAPETQFDSIPEPEPDLHPLEKLNREYAFVVSGGGHHILWETTDSSGNFRLEHLHEGTFHADLAHQVISTGDGRTSPLTELWMKHPSRRSYKGICFMPGREAPEGWYNLWRGFAVEPQNPQFGSTQEAQDSLTAFLEHTHENVCKGEEHLSKWLISYFAHLVQRPWEKPLVALVFRGGKGVGKNALVDRIGYLLGGHYLLTAKPRFLVGNFNAHLENCLLLTLDEAFWGGDKQAEGTLKDLITGTHHVIERKGKETYKVENCTRICIIGNEDWLVPASEDERRYAVFDVGDGKKQVRNYFQRMREGMERGGYALLLRYLLDYDIKNFDINAAPSTQGLMDQKLASQNLLHQYWFDSLKAGKFLFSEESQEWDSQIDKDNFRKAFRRYAVDRGKSQYLPSEHTIGRLLKKCLPSLDGNHKRREGSQLVNIYRLPSLSESRAQFEAFIGHTVPWESS